MKYQAGVSHCPKCGRQRVGDKEYDEEIRVMVYACDVEKTVTYLTWGDDIDDAPQIHITSVEKNLLVESPSP